VPKIVYFEKERWEEEYVRAYFNQEIFFTDEKLTQETVEKYQDTEIASVFIYSDISKTLLDMLTSLKFIATRSTGTDHIDLSTCKQKNIIVSNVPFYGKHAVAEHVFALILAISRKIIPSVEQVKRGNFSNLGLEGFDLFGKTLGVIGAGNIGQAVIDLAIAFGMKILVFSKHVNQDLAAKGVMFVDLDTLLVNSDIITLHAPLAKETEHIINLGNLEKIKKGSILINTARGGLVETQAIVEGVEKGVFKGVGLDVLEEEAQIREEKELISTEFLGKVNLKTELLNHVLLTKDEVIITPHNAFNSKEAVEEIITTSIANLKSYIDGKPINTIE
jgi:D-lactate dehydrogenase